MSFGIRGRLILLALVGTLCVLGQAYVAWASHARAKVFSPVYNDMVDDLALIADVNPPPAYALEISLVAHKYEDAETGERVALANRQADMLGEFEASWKNWVDKASANEVLHARRMAARDKGAESSSSEAVVSSRLAACSLAPWAMR